MNEKEAREKIKWSIQINNATKEINGDNTSINVQVLETVLNLLEKKDKQIDEMAKKINEAYFESGDFEEWFENKICKVQKYEDYTYLEKDIKQHFEYKV